MSRYLSKIRPAVMPFAVAQEDTLRWLMARILFRTEGHPDPEAARALNLYERLIGNPRIRQRQVILDDVCHTRWDEMELYGERQPSLAARMRIFEREADRLANELFDGALDAKYLIQVSCTGYTSPNALQKLTSAKESHARVWHVGHMGCYASIPALSMATQLDGPASLLFVELCSLHLDSDGASATQIVVNSLFADGAARIDVTSEKPSKGFLWCGSRERVLPQSLGDMTWTLGSSNFGMTLSREVPRKIVGALRDYVEEFLASLNLSLSEIDHFAIHPGGPRIVEAVAEALELKPGSTTHSDRVLQERGNLSSCSLPYIWNELLEDPNVRCGDRILSLAFGPGLTFASSVMERV
ncbi:MAG: 3-oxoacyl-[acyl-carrier-protein] synthase III C-terminal domain-containing protein [Bdellovibrionota bacterium]